MQLRRLEEISQNASRAERGLMIDGWSIGLSPGLAKRSRCVNPFYPSVRTFAENFDAAQAAFNAVKLPCLFRMTPFVSDANIDAQLAARGFIRFDTTLVQVLALAQLQLDHLQPSQATFLPQPNLAQAAAWLGAMRGDNASEVAALASRWANCAAHVEPMFAYDPTGNRIARSVTVTEERHVGIFDVGTLATHRRRGYASALLAYQLCAARDAGAHTAYLQVEPDNASRRIYERFGFRTAYEYGYRALPGDTH
jgi:ribosomal protein S18 acetylase RimI-like enzyme